MSRHYHQSWLCHVSNHSLQTTHLQHNIFWTTLSCMQPAYLVYKKEEKKHKKKQRGDNKENFLKKRRNTRGRKQNKTHKHKGICRKKNDNRTKEEDDDKVNPFSQLLLAITSCHFQCHYHKKNHLGLAYHVAVKVEPLVIVCQPPCYCSRNTWAM